MAKTVPTSLRTASVIATSAETRLTKAMGSWMVMRFVLGSLTASSGDSWVGPSARRNDYRPREADSNREARPVFHTCFNGIVHRRVIARIGLKARNDPAGRHRMTVALRCREAL